MHSDILTLQGVMPGMTRRVGGVSRPEGFHLKPLTSLNMGWSLQTQELLWKYQGDPGDEGNNQEPSQ
jgi:hypothetical protein